MDITPLIPKQRKVISGYGGGGFKINGEQVEGSILIFPDRVEPWQVGGGMHTALEKIVATKGIELLLIGTGLTRIPLPLDLTAGLKAQGIALEVMDTGAACRTYNVLLAEERKVAAALIAV